MSISFHEASVGTYLQLLEGLEAVLKQGAKHAEEKQVPLQDLVMARVHEDMMPLHFQVVSACHHSLGALQGMEAGRFSPPSFDLDKSYAQLQTLVADTKAGLSAIDEAHTAKLADQSMVFVLGKQEMPFSNQNFLMSFSLPNFYFHVTTTYDVLRQQGVPLSKRDYLGPMRMG